MDIYFCSYLKSGRTWFRYFLAQYCKLLLKSDVDIGFHMLGKVFQDHSEEPRDDLYADFPHITFGHITPDKLPEHPDNKYVFMFRSVCDTLVSQYFHDRTDNPDISGMVAHAKEKLHDWCNYVKACYRYRERAYTFTYEDMPDSVKIPALLRYCGIEVDKDIFDAAVELSRFGVMQQDELEHPMHPERKAGPDDRRVRRGKVDGYPDYFDGATVAALRDLCEDQLPNGELAWVQEMGVMRFGG